MAGAREVWTYGEVSLWTREADVGTLEKKGDVFEVTTTSKLDWSLGGFPRIAVEAGDIFEIRCKVKVVSDVVGARVETGVILRTVKGEVVNWSYGGTGLTGSSDWTEINTRFIVPRGVATIEPRVIGYERTSISVTDCIVSRVGSLLASRTFLTDEKVTLQGSVLSVVLEGASGCFTVTDSRTGRTWRQDDDAGWFVLDIVKSKDDRSATLRLLDPVTEREVMATLTIDERLPEIRVEISSQGELDKPLNFPAPFVTRPGERLIVPMNEGIGYPVEEENRGLWRAVAYGGHGLCMGFFGVAEDASGAGWMCILETPDDAAMNPEKGRSGLWQVGPSWDATMGQFGYTRKVRYIFFDKGGYVAMCKHYRETAKLVGLFKPFTEKVKRNPKIDLLIGAANIWSFNPGPDRVRLVAEMQSRGMDRILWSGNGNAAEIRAMNAMTNVLTSRYDLYQDIMDPADFDKILYKHGDWVTEAFPQDINWEEPNGQLRRGWQIEKKDGEEMIACAVICDSKAVPYARKRISEELKAKPFGARFIDTTVASPWFECYHPDHPMTRTQSRQYKMELLQLISKTFGLVCGSETGHEAAVPFCDYFEGMLSLGPYRVDDSGRHMGRVVDEVPESVSKYQVGEKYRLPLWELVYHDCVVAQWYWGDYNNKLPKIWRKRDLFNALYGTPPMYMFNMKQWDEMKDQFAASYQVAAPVSRATGYSEMTDHRILKADRSVQQTVFANGVTVTVNFGDAVYRMDDGTEILPLDLRVTGIPTHE